MNVKNNSINEFQMSNYRVIILCFSSNSNSSIQSGSKFIHVTCTLYEAAKPPSSLHVRSCAHSSLFLSFFLFSFLFCLLHSSDFSTLAMPIGSLALTSEFYYHISYRASIHFSNLIIKTPKFVPTKAKQNAFPPENDVKRKSNAESINQLSKQSLY